MNQDDFLIPLLAYQNGFLDREKLQAEFNLWIDQRNGSFVEHLVQRSLLQSDLVAMLHGLLEKHRRQDEELVELNKFFSVSSSVITNMMDVAKKVGDKELDKSIATIAMKVTGATAGQSKHSYTESARFRIVKKHAEGGLGIVYVAEDQEIRREVALKQIRDDRADDAGFQGKFKFEAAVTGQLEHPGIVPIYALGTDASGRPFYAMRFIQGESLRDAVQDFHAKRKAGKVIFSGPEFRQLLRRFTDVCNAIDYAHKQGVLHRDLKPLNIMLGKYGETLVVDWGLAKRLSDERSKTELSDSSNKLLGPAGGETEYGTFLGTAAYAPPEQLKGELEKLSPCSDVYSLGAILFELLTGTHPLEGVNDIATGLKAIKDASSFVNKLSAHHAPRSLSYICRKSLAYEQKDRYQTAATLRDEVQNWLDDQPIDGFAEPLTAKLGRWVRQHQALATGVLVTLLATMIILGISLIAVQNYAEKQRQLVEAEKELREQQRKSMLDGYLADIQVARERGQYKEAIRKLQLVSELRELTLDERFQMARDLFATQDVLASVKVLEGLEKSKLNPRQQAEYDLVQGDLLIMTKWERDAFKQIQAAIDSKALSKADEYYARALVAETVPECQANFRLSLKENPLDMNALTKLAVTSAFAGDFREATNLSEFGRAIAPDDPRVLFVDCLVAALTASQDFSAKIQEFKKLPNVQPEVEVLQLIYQLHVELQKYAGGKMDFKPFSFADASYFVRAYLSVGGKYGREDFVSFPLLGWMGTFSKAIPSFVTLSLTGPDQYFKILNKIRAVVPRNYLMTHLTGLAFFAPGKFEEAAEMFTMASQLDSPDPRFVRANIWAAIVTYAAIEFMEKKPFDEAGLASVVAKMKELDGLSTGADLGFVSSDIAWIVLLRTRLFSTAREFAELRIQKTEGVEKEKWELRKDKSDDIRKKVDEVIDISVADFNKMLNEKYATPAPAASEDMK